MTTTATATGGGNERPAEHGVYPWHENGEKRKMLLAARARAKSRGVDKEFSKLFARGSTTENIFNAPLNRVDLSRDYRQVVAISNLLIYLY